MHRSAIRHLKKSDPILAKLIERVGVCRLQKREEGKHFDYVARAIIYQQLSGSAAGTIHRRFTEIYGGRSPTPEELLATPEERLRAAGLSRQKIGYLLDLARKAESREVDFENLHELEDAAVVESLIRVKGVGVWTAQMFLMFRLGRPDVLPDLDLGIRKGIQRTYKLRKEPKAERVHRIGIAWAPYRTIASWYLWRSLELAEPVRTPAKKRRGANGKR